MEWLPKEFNIPAKHCSELELRSWRNLVTLFKNRRRRFRYVANLEKRLEAKEQKAKLRARFMLLTEALNAIDAGDRLGLEIKFAVERQGNAGEAKKKTTQEDTETEFSE